MLSISASLFSLDAGSEVRVVQKSVKPSIIKTGLSWQSSAKSIILSNTALMSKIWYSFLTIYWSCAHCLSIAHFYFLFITLFLPYMFFLHSILVYLALIWLLTDSFTFYPIVSLNSGSFFSTEQRYHFYHVWSCPGLLIMGKNRNGKEYLWKKHLL